jgi:hypothetical protein
VKRDVPLDLLHDLVNVAVEDGHGTKPLQQIERLRAIRGAPPPFRINFPERHVGEDHDGRAGGKRGEVLFQPIELVLAENAQALLGLAEDID